MEPRLTDALKTVFVFIIIFASGSSENDRDFAFCGTWRHGNGSLKLNYNLSRGCEGISISANESSLSVEGRITARCVQSDVIQLNHVSGGQSHFCLYWEPLLDQLWVKVGGQDHTLCKPAGLQDSCCTDLSSRPNEPEGAYGISNGSVRSDVVCSKTRTAYAFFGEKINCKKEFCDEAGQGSTQVNMIEEAVMRSQAVGNVELPCALSSVVEMKEDFRGYNVVLPAPRGVPPESMPSVHLPPALKLAAGKPAKVVCTFFQNTSLFQESRGDFRIVDNVVGITVENEIITDLPEPIKIGFHHNVIPKTHSRKCVSWDTRKDPRKVNWLEQGCLTNHKGAQETECLCNHLTYFTILVQLEPRPVRHLLALTVITSVGCLVSVISCIALIIFLYRKKGQGKEKSAPIHLGLAMSLLLLNLFFFSTGTVANTVGEKVCVWVGLSLHYALLSSFTWMAMEVFHTFWLVYMVFSPSPEAYVWPLIGFGLPAVPVTILAAVGDIYGVREVAQSDDINNPYLMCWMKDTPKASLAHYCTTIPLLAILVSGGLVMLFLVRRQIQTREEWRQNWVAFASIWGLSCLYGTTWGLAFLDFGPLSDFVVFLSCILNSFQGFLLMLRFYMLGWMRRRAGTSTLGTSTTGSTKHHMLQPQEEKS
ncbi:adhesion G-protein coupled receptor G5-like [Centroberyx affinis]|uniref:adhesion G-protein coupled receptor G5-like n=1 Tax=Centroberyx affinis TaxID=166261 RepID=UPI003A5BEA5F